MVSISHFTRCNSQLEWLNVPPKIKSYAAKNHPGRLNTQKQLILICHHQYLPGLIVLLTTRMFALIHGDMLFISYSPFLCSRWCLKQPLYFARKPPWSIPCYVWVCVCMCAVKWRGSHSLCCKSQQGSRPHLAPERVTSCRWTSVDLAASYWTEWCTTRWTVQQKMYSFVFI